MTLGMHLVQQSAGDPTSMQSICAVQWHRIAFIVSEPFASLCLIITDLEWVVRANGYSSSLPHLMCSVATDCCMPTCSECSMPAFHTGLQGKCVVAVK